MSNKSPIKPLAIALGAAFAASLASSGAYAAGNPFDQSELTGGYTVAENAADKAKMEGKCGEGKCGAKMKKEGMCGGMMGKDGMRGPAKFDANNDGKVTMDEFNAGHAEIFKKMDTDGDGVLSGDELNCPGMKQGCGSMRQDPPSADDAPPAN